MECVSVYILFYWKVCYILPNRQTKWNLNTTQGAKKHVQVDEKLINCQGLKTNFPKQSWFVVQFLVLHFHFTILELFVWFDLSCWWDLVNHRALGCVLDTFGKPSMSRVASRCFCNGVTEFGIFPSMKIQWNQQLKYWRNWECSLDIVGKLVTSTNASR
jgi:hypothetical protein